MLIFNDEVVKQVEKEAVVNADGDYLSVKLCPTDRSDAYYSVDGYPGVWAMWNSDDVVCTLRKVVLPIDAHYSMYRRFKQLAEVATDTTAMITAVVEEYHCDVEAAFDAIWEWIHNRKLIEFEHKKNKS